MTECDRLCCLGYWFGVSELLGRLGRPVRQTDSGPPDDLNSSLLSRHCAVSPDRSRQISNANQNSHAQASRAAVTCAQARLVGGSFVSHTLHKYGIHRLHSAFLIPWMTENKEIRLHLKMPIKLQLAPSLHVFIG